MGNTAIFEFISLYFLKFDIIFKNYRVFGHFILNMYIAAKFQKVVYISF